ncbi:hypothetical protein [Paucidesulfovibrio longus]|uniref:hypothetical protein n=1 Tax=Paucidesulfovibrio longus TaxID=889 RepID=UPI0012DE54E0|nr:hypothetical protein [Paucidesulfovibrio longus]
MSTEAKPERVKRLHYENGRIYFSRQTERAFFFVLTVLMLLLGVVEGSKIFGG